MPRDILKPFETQLVRLRPGETLFRQGAAAQHLFDVRKGRVRLVRHTEDGDSMTLHVATAGELFAEGALFADVYHCGAIADIASEIQLLDKAALQVQMRRDAALAMLFLERVTRQLHRARALAELRNIRSADARVLQHLRLSLPTGAPHIRFEQPLVQVATELGLTHEAYYRSLARLARSGVIEREGRTIRICTAETGVRP
jgi:CRP/FNR family transcriptional regulator, dissimilatory nitrate respiration regulator